MAGFNQWRVQWFIRWSRPDDDQRLGGLMAASVRGVIYNGLYVVCLLPSVLNSPSNMLPLPKLFGTKKMCQCCCKNWQKLWPPATGVEFKEVSLGSPCCLRNDAQYEWMFLCSKRLHLALQSRYRWWHLLHHLQECPCTIRFQWHLNKRHFLEVLDFFFI